MPASMIIALAGFMRKVSGSSIAIVAGGPSPGMMPTMVPRKTPTKHQNRFAGCSASAKPCISPPRTSTSGERQAERDRKDEIEARDDADRHQRGDRRRPAIHHRDDEERQHREADQEADNLQHRDGDGERAPGGERTSRALPRTRRTFAFQHKGERKDQHRDPVPERKESRPGAVLA